MRSIVTVTSAGVGAPSVSIPFTDARIRTSMPVFGSIQTCPLSVAGSPAILRFKGIYIRPLLDNTCPLKVEGGNNPKTVLRQARFSGYFFTDKPVLIILNILLTYILRYLFNFIFYIHWFRYTFYSQA